jgi:hypothetical protein
MDSYNRGYQPGIAGLSGTSIGTAEILADSSSQLGLAVTRDAGFYATSYTMGAGVDGVSAGTKVISFRGTDFDMGGGLQEFRLDFWNGWSTFLGFGSNSQFPLARAYFRAVAKSDFPVGADAPPVNVLTTGHSLGGALAGFTAARGKVESYAVDPIPYGVTAWADAISDAWQATLKEFNLGLWDIVSATVGLVIPGTDTTWQRFVARFVEHLSDRRPALSSVKGVYLEGEIASSILTLQPILASLLASGGLLFPGLGAAISALGLQQAIAGVMNNAVEDRGGLEKIKNHGVSGDPILLHSPALITLLLFGERQWPTEQGRSDWTGVVRYFLAPVFDKEVATGLGRVEAEGERNPGTGLTSPGEQLTRIIAYSAINEGTRVFGDTGIRALFDDGQDLGLALALPPNLLPESFDEEARKQVGRLIAEYAGLLATKRSSRPRMPTPRTA